MFRRRVAPALIVPGVLFCLNLVLFVSERLDGEPLESGWYMGGQLAGILATISAAAVAAPVVAWTALHRAARLVELGAIDPFTACRRTYLVAEGSAAIGWASLSMVVLLMTGLRLSDPIMSVALFIFWLVCSGAGAARLLAFRSPAGGATGEECPTLEGQARALDPESPLGAFIHSVARSAHVAPPQHIVFGLYPAVVALTQDVKVGEQRLSGGTLYLSLPMCHVLDRGELAGLVAFGMAGWPLDAAGWPRFFRLARDVTESLLSLRPSNPVVRAAFDPVFVPLQLWAETWEGIDLMVLRYAARRGSVAAGREAMASALARQVLYPDTMGRFLSALKRDVREPQPSQAELDVSRRLAQLWNTLPSEPQFSGFFESLETLERESHLLAFLVAGLGVDPPVVLQRLRSAALDPVIDLVDDAASIERELSLETIEKVRPWPSGPGKTRRERPASSDAPADARGAGSRQAGEAQRDERPLFAAPARRRSSEGVVMGILAVLLAVWVAWIALEPVVHRVFPELGATRVGPEAFPYTVHLGRETVSFTNRSDTPWGCKAEAGYPHTGESYVVHFVLGPHETRELPYRDFRSTGPDVRSSVSRVRRAARSRGTLDCSEPTGVAHLSSW